MAVRGHPAKFVSADGLLAAMRRLDALLESAVIAAETAYGPDGGADRLRGLHIDIGDAERMLTRAPGTSPLWLEDVRSVPVDRSDGPGLSGLAWLRESFGLSNFDLDIILVALAPEIDLKYERLYAYLQDDVSRRRPTLDLALNLLCPSAQEKLGRRRHVAADAPLIREGLIHLIPDLQAVHPPLLAHNLKLDEQIVRLILGEDSLDGRLASFSEMIEPRSGTDGVAPNGAVIDSLRPLVGDAWAARRGLTLYLQGPAGVGKRHTALELVGKVNARLLVADLRRAPTTAVDFERAVEILLREAFLRDAIVYLEELDALRADEDTQRHRLLLDALAHCGGVTIIAGERPWLPVAHGPKGLVHVALPVPGFAHRRAWWQSRLDEKGISIAEAELTALADRFRLTPAQIADAVETAGNRASCRAAASIGTTPSPESADLFAAARAQSDHALAALGRKIEPRHTWADIVLPDDALTQLRELCQRVAQHHRVLDDWGFARKLSLGKGVNALFAGPSGTGKTMAAEIIAGELGLDLYRIDLSQVVSKYIGETEKNLNRVFAAAENANAILFFDEADALFGKRSEVRDSHDRYANIEISYLLQKMEEYDGVAILATNLSQNLDDAFNRRLAFTIHFPFPDETMRQRIWAGIWPGEAPLSEDLRLGLVAGQFRLSGGNIRNVALAASFLAAADGRRIALDHILQATRREYQKLGRVLSDAELQETQGD